MHPALGVDELGRAGLVPVIADSDVAPPREDLAVLRDADLDPRDGRSDGADAYRSRPVHGADPAVLRLAVDLGDGQTEPLEPTEQVGVHRSGARDEEAGFVEPEPGTDGATDQGVECPVLESLDE